MQTLTALTFNHDIIQTAREAYAKSCHTRLMPNACERAAQFVGHDIHPRVRFGDARDQIRVCDTHVQNDIEGGLVATKVAQDRPHRCKRRIGIPNRSKTLVLGKKTVDHALLRASCGGLVLGSTRQPRVDWRA